MTLPIQRRDAAGKRIADSAKLDAALLNNSDDVRRLFAFDFSTSDPRITLLSFNGATRYAAAGYSLNMAFGAPDTANIDGAANGADDGSATVAANVITVNTTDAKGLA